MQPASKKHRTIWELALLVLGLNLWVSFLLMPVLHLAAPTIARSIWLLLPLSLGLLALGLARLSRTILLGAYPSCLIISTLFEPHLVGVNVYSPWGFLLVDLSFLAYLLAALLVLRLAQPWTPSQEAHPLPLKPTSEHWRRRFRMYVWFAGQAVLFPGVLVFVLFLHPGVQADLRRSYPGRSEEALVLFGVLAVALWLGIFRANFWIPLRAHLRGDSRFLYDLQQQRRKALNPRPRLTLYLYAGSLVVLVFFLFWLRLKGQPG
jgi:hypothetical protein